MTDGQWVRGIRFGCGGGFGMIDGRPLIGVTPWYDYKKNVTFIKPGYCEGVAKAGGLPLLLPLTSDEELLADIFSRFDGFLISGGPDVDAKHYGEHNLPFNEDISPHRDIMEIFIARKAIQEGKPVFGICRGIQVMNVAMGGTLYQDIYSQLKDKELLLKHSQEAPKWYPTHDIIIEKNSIVWKSFSKEKVGVNTFHHQAVKDVAPGFLVSSRSPDGIIESIEYEGHVFAVGVQWHPELMWQEDEIYLNLFAEFVESCGRKCK